MDCIDRLYERLDYPWYLHPFILFIVAICLFALAVGFLFGN